ncbi:RNA polymerase sigma factor [Alteribacter natronophilus]|uniref:RNA polymerase sigma factor n=1 Tax=Alteribacter natronophilus TaxID=2583810 RepID=UPI00110F152B|nr:RNA polymerase sigma factor [Alteribacter natronophilus]TMW71059.1 RNA polymerase sigma factor [Alteribacter natronophilus]
MQNEQLGILATRFQEGDEEAFERLYEHLHPPLYAFLFRFTRNEQMSMDLVQDTFLKFYRSRSAYRPEKAGVKTYLFRIGYTLMINRVNRRKKWQKIMPFLVPDPVSEASPEDRVTIREALLRLPEKQRAAVILYYYHDLRHREIADVLGIAEGTVKSRIFSGVSKLRRELEGELDEERRERTKV